MISSKLLQSALPSTVFVALCALATLAGAENAAKTMVTTAQVRAELLAHAPDGADAGKTVWVGLQLTHQPDWHTYWKNSGDSGLPTTLQWTLPAGVTAGDIAWPLPKKIPIGNLANYGFDGTVLLPVPLTITPDFKPTPPGNEIDVKLKANWLVCRKECIPEEGEFALKLPVKGSTAMSSAAFNAAFAAQPQPVMASTPGALPDSSVQIDGTTIRLTVQGLPAALRGKTLDFFPETPEVIATAAPWTQAWKGGVWSAQVPLSAERSNSPTIMPVVLAAQGQGYRAELKVLGTWPKLAAGAAGSDSLETLAPPAPPPITLLAALLGALLGGLILNLMPCVFPVLAIKVMSFTRHASD